MKPFFTTLSLIACMGAAGSATALGITTGDVTNDLGPDFFLDEVVSGGGDVTVTEGANTLARENFATNGPLNVGAGGTEITITGVGWFGPNWLGTTASQVQLSIRYLGADGVGGVDDVLIGTVTDSYTFGGAAEYVWKFDAPMVQVIDGANSFFRFEFTVIDTDGGVTESFRIKKLDGGNTKLAAAGTSVAVSGLIPGDADGDGDVDDSDLGTALSNYTGPLDPGVGTKTLAEGDTDGDGDVDDSDLGTALSGYTGPLATAVPEPASLSLLAVAGLFAARRRRA